MMTTKMHGHLDTCNADGISGWAWSSAHPERHLLVICEIDGKVAATAEARQYRGDLLAAGIGNGEHGFRIEVPVEYFDGVKHAVNVYVLLENEKTPLLGSPSSFSITQDQLIQGAFEIHNDGFLHGWVVDKNDPSRTVSVEVCAVGVGHFTLNAVIFRHDLVSFKGGTGIHGFQAVLPEAWHANPTLSIEVREVLSRKLIGEIVEFNTANSYYSECKCDELTKPSLEEHQPTPLISVVLPVYNPPPQYLEAAIESVLAQTYRTWELCIADDASTDPAVRAVLEAYLSKDDRIKVIWRKENGHICRSSNSAISIASGDFIALLDHDDVLHKHALQEVASVIHRQPDVGLIFTDEDKCDENGVRYAPYRKIGWDPELLLGQNCISHLGVFKTDLVRALGGFREGYEGSQDYDLALRVSSQLKPNQVQHIPRVLYHWRAIPGSTALSNSEKSYAVIAMRRALQSHLNQVSPYSACKPAVQGIFCRVAWQSAQRPSLSLMIPFAGIDKKAREVASRFAALGLQNIQILAASIGTEEGVADLRARRLHYLQSLLAAANGDVCIWLESAQPCGELVNWITELSSQAERLDIAFVGPKLLTKSMTVHNAGLKFRDPNDISSYEALYRGLGADDPGHGGCAGLSRSVQALSENVFACRRQILQTLLHDPPISPNAPGLTELVLRAARRDMRTIVTPFATAVISD